MKKTDTLSTVTLLATLDLFVIAYGLYKSQKILYGSFFILFILVIILAVTYKKGTAKIVENNFDGETGYLDEDGNYKCLPAKTKLTGVDGLRNSYKPNHAYKLRNGQNAVITEKGEIKPVNIISRMLAPGYQTKDKYPKYWERLFNENC